jgi:oxygen-independent coproporphyrinogen-3 oxidase
VEKQIAIGESAGSVAPGRLEISEEFLRRYDRPGPRYTSYPTAPVWQESFGRVEFEAAMAEADARATPVSLYLHIPFCQSLCLFCACNVVIEKDHGAPVPYLAALRREIETFAKFVSRRRPVVQLHWGGGTPTYLTPEQIEDLFAWTRERFHLAADAEIGIEVDPRVTTEAHLETLARLGFNRLSMGVQDFNPVVQQTVHRIQPYEMTRATVDAARALGFSSINIDLIYGLPHQTAESFRATVDRLLTLAPDRIAVFSYAHVPWLKKQQGSFARHLPEGMEKFRIFRAGLEGLLAGGYVYIGMDHFARPEDELAVAQRDRTLHRNFQGYSTRAGADLYGMGLSAISGVSAAYAQNWRDLARYYAAIERDGMATMRGYRLSADDLVRRAVISRLLCHTVIRKEEIEREFAIRFDDYFSEALARLEQFRADGLVTLAPEEIRVTPLGRIFIRNVAMVFDRYLDEQPGDRPPIFSRTL